MEDKCNIQHAYRKILVRPETKIFLKKKHLFFVLSILWGGISMLHEENVLTWVCPAICPPLCHDYIKVCNIFLFL